MKLKTFLIILKKYFINKYPTIEFDFYVSRRNLCVHMGLDKPVASYTFFMDIITDISNSWKENKQNHRFNCVVPYLINSVT